MSDIARGGRMLKTRGVYILDVSLVRRGLSYGGLEERAVAVRAWNSTRVRETLRLWRKERLRHPCARPSLTRLLGGDFL